MLVVYVVNNGAPVGEIPAWRFSLYLIIAIIATTALSLLVAGHLENESTLNGEEDSKHNDCADCAIADSSFLPIYLGYFFVALSVSGLVSMLFVFATVFVFTFVSQTQYFNPILLLWPFHYHFYHLKTAAGTSIFVIKRGPVIRNAEDMELNNLRRINNTTFIDRK